MARFIATNCELKTVNKPGSDNHGHKYIQCVLLNKNYDQEQGITHFIWLRGNKTLEDKYIAMLSDDGRLLTASGQDYEFMGVRIIHKPEQPFFKKHSRTRATRRGQITAGDYVRDANGKPILYNSQSVFCMKYYDEDEGCTVFAQGQDPETVFGRMLQDIFIPAIEIPHPTIDGKTIWVTPEEAKGGTSNSTPESAGNGQSTGNNNPPQLDTNGNPIGSTPTRIEPPTGMQIPAGFEWDYTTGQLKQSTPTT